MNPEEYQQLGSVEDTHWFYKGKRIITKEWIQRFYPLNSRSTLLDIGAGSGMFAAEMNQWCRAFGVESSKDGLNVAKQKGYAQHMIAGSATTIPCKDQSADITTALDVLEHIQDDAAALKEFLRVTKKNGIILLTVPAFSWAFSSWDKSLGHFRRYQIKDLNHLVENIPVEILHASYFNSIFFFPIAIYRKLKDLFLPHTPSRLEDAIPPRWLNNFLLSLFIVPAMWSWFRPPFGLSVLFILRRTD